MVVEMTPEMAAARAALAAKFGNVRTGGKGSVRRSKKQVRTSNASDDKRLQATLKRMGVTMIPGIEEVNMFKDDGHVVHFDNPKVQASIQANTFVISGNAENKPLQEMLPGIIQQMGPEALTNLQRIAETVAAKNGGGEDEDVPDLVENFDEVA